ncbi:TolB family protein [Kineococcus sp. SYSU DK003]|uniref:TolB family protein n=1 Tax=Kineococcus sp. SYSU DK003 TaxID=3383124 RepID=UPI003D7EAC1C
MSSRRLSFLVGCVVLLLGIAAVLATATVSDRREAPARATVPQQMPGYSRLTADLARHPVGAALALYRQGSGLDVAGVPQALVVGADGASTRRLDQAVRRGAPDVREVPAPVRLSPDGRTAAIGDWNAARSSSDLAFVDLGTGATRVFPVPPVAGAVPLAWSHDGGRLAYLAPDRPPAPSSRSSGPTSGPTSGSTSGPSSDQVSGQLFVFDTRTDRAAAVPGAADVVAAAFSPDGSRLAVQGTTAAAVRIVDPVGGAGRQVPVPAGMRLAGAAAWSPDGELLALRDGDRHLLFVATTPGREVPRPVPGRGDVLGWVAEDAVLHQAPAQGPGHRTDFRVLRTDLADGSATPYLRIPTGGGSYAVSDLSLATALLPHAVTVQATEVDRGPWPLPLRLALVVVGALTAVSASAGLRRRWASLQRVLAVPDWARDSARG